MKSRTNIFRIVRIALACVFIVGLTLLFLDATIMRPYVGWMAKLQLWPSILGLSLITLALLLVLTIGIGRLYCSVICPLGILQDLFIWLGNRKWMKKLGKHLGPNRFRPGKELKWLRFGILILFIILSCFPITAVWAHFLEPYSLFGKAVAAVTTSYYSWAAYAIVAALLLIICTMALLRGRLWCNALCPVGTVLSIFSRRPILALQIDTDKCNGCQKCARNCKSECIDPESHTIDMSRCVDCFDCIGNCNQHAISLRPTHTAAKTAAAKEPAVDESRRKFLATTAVVAAAGTVSAAVHNGDGGLAIIEDKKLPTRATGLRPAGSKSLKYFTNHCTACQLCVSACPQHVLRPSMKAGNFMQPEMQFDLSYCPPTCHACSDVCPAGAIRLDKPEDKAAIQIGHAVWIKENCVVLQDGVSCGNCERHCPTGAIVMVETEGSEHKIPTVDTEKCIGCGHCEYVCPSRPFSAIYVEGHEIHRTI